MRVFDKEACRLMFFTHAQHEMWDVCIMLCMLLGPVWLEIKISSLSLSNGEHASEWGLPFSFKPKHTLSVVDTPVTLVVTRNQAGSQRCKPYNNSSACLIRPPHPYKLDTP